MDDLWVFWMAYNTGSFPDMTKGLTKDMFYKLILDKLSKTDGNLLIEDQVNKKIFNSGRGPVGFIMITQEGRRIEPKAVFFSWAKPLNVLRSCVRYFNWISYNKEVSSCVIRCYDDSVNLFHHVKDYGVLFYVGKVVKGNPSGTGDEYIFSVKGKYDSSSKSSSKE